MGQSLILEDFEQIRGHLAAREKDRECHQTFITGGFPQLLAFFRKREKRIIRGLSETPLCSDLGLNPLILSTAISYRGKG